MIYGYARVSTKDQNLDRQVKALEEAGCDVIFQEKITGTKRGREELNRMLDGLQEGDTVIVKDLTRISRSTKDLIELVEIIGNKKAGFKSLNESWLDTTKNDAVSKLMFTIFAGLVEFERNQLSERTIEGLAIAKSKGKTGGRPKKNGDTVQHAIELFKEGDKSIAEICRNTGVSRPTLYRRLKELGLKS
jgi:DNA invertase Pin-like site-specific DNA recombinase